MAEGQPGEQDIKGEQVLHDMLEKRDFGRQYLCFGCGKHDQEDVGLLVSKI